MQPQQRLDAMVETRESFKRCETYKVAQFRRLPLMSVPDVTEYADSNSTEANKPENKTRHKSESFLNPKLTFNKFKGIRGVQIDKARRRAKKITTNIDVDSSRSEFSIKPDQACTTQIKSSTLSYKQPKKPGVAKTSNESKENSQESADSKLKFKFRGKTLHLNATDAKSTFAHIEALRVFLEENLGTERFIEAYQYLNGSSLFTTKKDTNKDDAGLESILGRYNIDYLPLLTQLIASEANHFGTSV